MIDSIKTFRKFDTVTKEKKRRGCGGELVCDVINVLFYLFNVTRLQKKK